MPLQEQGVGGHASDGGSKDRLILGPGSRGGQPIGRTASGGESRGKIQIGDGVRVPYGAVRCEAMCNRASSYPFCSGPLRRPSRLELGTLSPCLLCFGLCGRRWTMLWKMALRANLRETEAEFFAILFVMGKEVRLLGVYGDLPLRSSYHNTRERTLCRCRCRLSYRYKN